MTTRFETRSDAELVELVHGNPLGADGLAAVVEMMGRLRASQVAATTSADRWSRWLTRLTVALVVLTVVLVVIGGATAWLAWEAFRAAR